MKTDNVFFVDFSGDKIMILHSKCGSPAELVPKSEDNEDSIGFSCPICEFETVYFRKSAWAKVLEKLREAPLKSKTVIRKAYTMGGRVLSSKRIIVFERREIL